MRPLPVPDAPSTFVGLLKTLVMLWILVGTVGGVLDAFSPFPWQLTIIAMTAIWTTSARRAGGDYLKNREALHPPTHQPHVIPLSFGLSLTVRRKHLADSVEATPPPN